MYAASEYVDAPFEKYNKYTNCFMNETNYTLLLLAERGLAGSLLDYTIETHGNRGPCVPRNTRVCMYAAFACTPVCTD